MTSPRAPNTLTHALSPNSARSRRSTHSPKSSKFDDVVVRAPLVFEDGEANLVVEGDADIHVIQPTHKNFIAQILPNQLTFLGARSLSLSSEHYAQSPGKAQTPKLITPKTQTPNTRSPKFNAISGTLNANTNVQHAYDVTPQRGVDDDHNNGDADANDDNEEAIGHAAVTYGVSWKRWWVLWLYWWIGTFQNAVMMTYTVTATETKAYYGVTQSTINWWLAMSPIASLALQYPSAWLLKRRCGLYILLLICVILPTMSSVLRILIPGGKSGAIGLVWAAQALNALVSSPANTPPAHLSVLWFPEHQRTLATTIGALANTCGAVVTWAALPMMAEKYGMPVVLYSTAIFGGVLMLLTLVTLPKRPALPPTIRAAETVEFTGVVESEMGTDLRLFAFNRSTILSLVVFSVVPGLFNALAGLLNPIINTQWPNSDVYAGYVGFGGTLAGIVGAIAASLLLEKYFRHQYKIVMQSALIGLAVCAWLATLSMPSAVFGKPVIHPTQGYIAGLLIVAGMIMGTISLSYEFMAEISFPVAESVSCGALVFGANLVSGIMLIVTANISVLLVTFILAVGYTLCAIAFTPVRGECKRHLHEVDVQRKAAVEAEEDARGDQIL